MKIPFLIGLSGVIAAVIAAQATSADTLLEKHTKQLQTATTFTAQYTVQNLPGGPVEYKLKLAKPNKFRLETPDEIVVGNGTTVWSYTKKTNSYTEIPQESSDLKKLLKRDAVLAWSAFFVKEPFKDFTSVKVGANRTVKGNAVTEVAATLPEKPQKDATYLIDQNLGVARGILIKVAPDKDTVVMAKELTLGSTAPKDADYEFVAPDGAKKLDAKVAAASGFEKVASIFQANCVGCHGSARPRAGLDLTSYAGAMAGGRSGKAIIPGDPNNSPIINYLTANNQPLMPPAGPLSSGDIATISAWIKDGAQQ